MYIYIHITVNGLEVYYVYVSCTYRYEKYYNNMYIQILDVCACVPGDSFVKEIL